MRTNDSASRIGAHNRHCFKGVEREIEKHLQQLYRICPDLAGIRTNFRDHRHLPFQSNSANNPEEAVNCLIDLDQGAATLRFANHVADALDNLAGPAAVSHDVVEQLL